MGIDFVIITVTDVPHALQLALLPSFFSNTLDCLFLSAMIPSSCSVEQFNSCFATATMRKTHRHQKKELITSEALSSDGLEPVWNSSGSENYFESTRWLYHHCE